MNLFPAIDPWQAGQAEILSADNVAGVLLSIRWRDLECDMNSYGWALIDDVLAKCEAAGKRMHLAVLTARNTPDWLECPRMSHYEKGERYWVPVPWSGRYLDACCRLAFALGARYDGRIEMVYASGPSVMCGIETVLNVTDRDEMKFLLTEGQYHPIVFQWAWRHGVRAYAGAFPMTHVAGALHPWVMGNKSSRLFVDIMADATRSLGRRLVPTYLFLSPTLATRAFAGKYSGDAQVARHVYQNRADYDLVGAHICRQASPQWRERAIAAGWQLGAKYVEYATI